MNDIQISVVIPAYNVENFIQKSVDSILKQEYNNYEIIIVNDGSTDNTLAVSQKLYGNLDNVKIITQKNQGSGAARNTGLENASGKWVYFMDPDDSLEGTVFVEIIEKLSYYDKIPDIIWFNYKGHFSDGESLPIIFKLEERYFENKNDISVFFDNLGVNDAKLALTVWTKFFKRSFILDNNLRFTHQRTGQDAVFTLDAFIKVTSLLCLDKQFYNYLENRPGSAQNQKNIDKINDELNIYLKLQSYFKERKLVKSVFDNFYFMRIVLNEFKNLDVKSFRDFKSYMTQSKVSSLLYDVDISKLKLKYRLFYKIRKSIKLSYLFYKLGLESG